MKIAILVKVFPPSSLGGTEFATLNIAKNLSEKHDVNVLTIQKQKLPKQEIINNFKLFRLSTTNILFINHFIYFLKILKNLKKINPDVIHAQMLYSEALFGVIIKKILNVPFIVYPRGVDIYMSSPYYKKTILRFIFKNTDIVLAQTNDMKNEIQKVYNRKVIVIPNGTNPEKYTELKKNICRQELGIDKNISVVIYIGRLVKKKCVDDLIQAIDKVVIKDKNIILLIVGEGIEREKLESLTNNLNLERYVKFVGKVTNELIPKYIKASDIFALISYAEGYPMVFTEVLPSGIPIITSNNGPNPEIINNKINGIVVELHNISQIANAIKLLLEDKDLNKEIYKNNIKKASENSWKNVVKQLEKVYQSTVG